MMSIEASGPRNLRSVLRGCAFLILTAAIVCPGESVAAEPVHEIEVDGRKVDVFDLGLWREYRGTVKHPATVYKADDIARAKRNVAQHAWAKKRLEAMEAALPAWWPGDEAFLEKMIPATTPGAVIFTMCPHCEYSPAHGQYSWDPKDPEKLVCKGCGTVYPNEQYPEDMAIETAATGPQRLTYYGSKSWHFYDHHIRSSWTGQIRLRKATYMASQTAAFAKVYALTGKLEHARQVRRLLLRFAEVYPNYLVHSGYGEYADLPPKVAAVAVNALPADEKNLPPNVPNRRLHPDWNGYWMCGRLACSGGEGHPVLDWAVAYDLTCDARDDSGGPVYSEDERVRIERDLLLESTYLMMADAGFNNKSITNRRATAVVGACVGDPMRVRFGLEALRHMAREWYLYDGNPGESPAYGLMTLRGMVPMSEGLAGYSDPPGFSLEGRRLDDFDPYAEPAYRAVFDALTETVLPDLRYPAWADSYFTTSLTPDLTEVAATRYPTPRMRAFRERSYAKMEAVENEYALFHREADTGETPVPHHTGGTPVPQHTDGTPVPHPTGGTAVPHHTGETPVPQESVPQGEFSHSSMYWPAWKAAYLRIGPGGLLGTAILSSSDWGGHHHRDALNLSLYWRDQECLTDLGYLWDSPNSNMSRRTFAHNTVIVDEQEQGTTGRHGSLHLFDASGPYQVVTMSSTVYDGLAEQGSAPGPYARTIITIPIEDQGYAVVDVFRVGVGKVRDLVYHGPHEDWKLEGASMEAAADVALYDLTKLQRVRSVAESKPWSMSWPMSDGVRFTVIHLPGGSEEAFIGSGWGSRDRADTETRIPYVVRRQTGAGLSQFVTVYVLADEGAPHVTAESLISGDTSAWIGLTIGDAQYGVACEASGGGRSLKGREHRLESDGLVTIRTRRGGDVRLDMWGGTRATTDPGLTIEQTPTLDAQVTEVHRGADESYVVLRPREGEVDTASLVGRIMILEAAGQPSFFTGVPILDASDAGEGRIRVVTKRGGSGFDPIDARSARVHFYASASMKAD